MAISKEKKGEISKVLDAALAEAKSTVFVNFHGLTLGEVTEMRKKLRDNGVKYYVAKKTLIRRALDAKKVTGTIPELAGELGIAWSPSDIIAPAKGVAEFAKTHKEHISILGGVYEGAFIDASAMQALAAIPSREAMFGQFVGMLNESIAKVVRVIDAKAKLEPQAVA